MTSGLHDPTVMIREDCQKVVFPASLGRSFAHSKQWALQIELELPFMLITIDHLSWGSGKLEFEDLSEFG